MIYFCCDERRRAFVHKHGLVNGVDYNGIDFLEIDTDAPTQSERQHTLHVHFIKKTGLKQLTANNIIIEGGVRIRGIIATNLIVGPTPQNPRLDDNVLTIDVANPPSPTGETVVGVGDFSSYTLRLVQDARHAGGTSVGGQPPQGFDPALSAVSFSFKVECPSDFDCRPERVCPPETATEPEIDYLAKDYNSFRRLMLDRLAVLMPQWSERNAADLGVALVELLAYVGDHLSYQQDTIATEAYLDTARRRVSVRRHALLVDYFMHDGCNARAWIFFEAAAHKVQLNKGARLITNVPGLMPVVSPEADEAKSLIATAQTESFETMQDATLFSAHNEIEFYPWGEERCCLPAGSTRATLKGDFPHLHAGDVLVFEEVAGALTGNAADADPAHRHAVRLTKVESSDDPLAKDSHDNPFDQPLTEIQWHDDDALPFALCISMRTETNEYKPKISVARGNVVLADHGCTFTEQLGAPLPADEALAAVWSAAEGFCEEREATPTLPRFRPQLKRQPLTQAAPLNLHEQSQSRIPFYRDPNASASAVFRWEMRDVLPAIRLQDGDGRPWHPQRDLLSSDAFAEEFVAEVDDDGRATLRFGDDQYGLRPTPGVEFTATYRIGNGSSGNVGAETLVHLITDVTGIVSVRNPMAAHGGADPESLEHVRRVAPDVFHIQERAVTPADYTEVAMRHREVQDAAATVRWTGSWRTIFLTIERRGGRPVDAEFEHDMRLHLERYRMAGQDVEIDGPQFVPLEIEMTVCVQPNYYRSDVKAALLRVFSNQTQPDRKRGVFHPDNFSFGQPVYLSKLYAAAQQVEGVRFVTIEKFQRLGRDSGQVLRDGVLNLGRLEVARVDNDPNFAERGVFRLTMEGGK